MSIKIDTMRSAIFAFCTLLALELRFNNAVEFKFTNAVCKSFNQSWVVIHECRLRAINRQKTTFNFNSTILYPAHNVGVKGQLFKRANGYKPWLYKANLDVCQFLKKSFNPVAIMIFKLFRDYTNLNHPCPFEGTQLVKGLYIDYDKVPIPMPSGDFLLEINWTFDGKIQVCTNLYFRVKDDF